MCRNRLLRLSWGFCARSCKSFLEVPMLAHRLGFMIATNNLFTVSICATCRLRRNIPGKLANMSSVSCSRTTCLRRNDYFISKKSWLVINLRAIDSYWKNNEVTEEDWVQTFVMLSLFTSGLNKIYANLESIKEMQSCFHQRVFFLIDPIIICSKQSSLSPLLLVIAPMFIHKVKRLLQIHSPMAREWKKLGRWSDHVTEIVPFLHFDAVIDILWLTVFRREKKLHWMTWRHIMNLDQFEWHAVLSLIDQFSEYFFVLICRISADSLSNV